MTKKLHIPMSPTELPQQRIHEVLEFAERPEPFDCIVGYGAVPTSAIPKNGPSSPIYLAQVEWAWSPMHSRVSAYYLHRGRSHWVLWLRSYDDNYGCWDWQAIGCVPKKGVSQRQAATFLLMEMWKHEISDGGLDQFHWINENEYLSVAELMAIARAIWT